jgi:hypothetical protein
VRFDKKMTIFVRKITNNMHVINILSIYLHKISKGLVRFDGIEKIISNLELNKNNHSIWLT